MENFKNIKGTVYKLNLSNDMIPKDSQILVEQQTGGYDIQKAHRDLVVSKDCFIESTRMVWKIENKIDYVEFRKYAHEQMFKIMEESNCRMYKIIGWKFLDIRMILYFHDCNQVFDFMMYGENEIKVSKFFTKDFNEEERTEISKNFTNEFNIDLPEQK